MFWKRQHKVGAPQEKGDVLIDCYQLNRLRASPKDQVRLIFADHPLVPFYSLLPKKLEKQPTEELIS